MPKEEGGPHDSRPFFVIPYWPPAPPGVSGDTGQRPLPASATWYLCEGIHASPYQPGTDLKVSVDVRNFGGSNAPSLAQVTVWWSDPTTGFVIEPSRMIGFEMVAVPPRGGSARTKPMVKQIPASAPNHICLIARVTHQYDRAGELVAPAADRHWAQRNIAVLQAPPREPAVLEFVAGNPFPEAGEFDLYVRPLENGDFGGGVSGELVSRPALFVVDGRQKFEGAGSFSIALEPGEQRPVRLSIRIDDLGRDQFAAFTISQQLGDLHVGGLGVAVAATHDH